METENKKSSNSNDNHEVIIPIKSKSEKPLRVLLYLRVSSKKQDTKDKHGLESQEYFCKKWARENDFKINKIIKDIGTAKLGKGQINLTNFIDEELDDSKYKWMIICYRIDRIFRCMKFFEQLNPVIESNNTIIFSCSEKTSDEKKIIQLIKQSSNELKSISSRVKTGLENRKANGLPLGRAPYGFKRSADGLSNEIDPETYPIATIIQQMRDYEPSEKQVRVEMLQLPTAFASSESQHWTFDLISKLLTEAKTTYKGKPWNGENVAYVYHSFIKHEDIFFTNDIIPLNKNEKDLKN
jgi:DNA invertase Pin-like site-specific DNA recombinase